MDFLNDVFAALESVKTKRKKKGTKKRTRFAILKEAAQARNMVLERNKRRIDGVMYNYDVYNNDTFTGDCCVSLDEVYDVIYSTPLPE